MHRISRVAPALNQFPDRTETIVVYACYFLLLLWLFFSSPFNLDLRRERNGGRMVAGWGEHSVA